MGKPTVSRELQGQQDFLQGWGARPEGQGPSPPGHTLGAALASALLDTGGSSTVRQHKGYWPEGRECGPLCPLLTGHRDLGGGPHEPHFREKTKVQGGPQSGTEGPGPDWVQCRHGTDWAGAAKGRGNCCLPHFKRPPTCFLGAHPRPQAPLGPAVSREQSEAQRLWAGRGSVLVPQGTPAPPGRPQLRAGRGPDRRGGQIDVRPLRERCGHGQQGALAKRPPGRATGADGSQCRPRRLPNEPHAIFHPIFFQ